MENDHPHHPHGVPPGPAAPRRSNLPLGGIVWELIHADYVAGCSATVLAERYGLSERTVRRRAARDGWRYDRPEHLQGLRTGPADESFRRLTRSLAGEPPSADEALDDSPDLELFTAAHDHEIAQLLLRPAPERLSRFAFRRAAECAAEGKPAEAGAWMRLVTSVSRTEGWMRNAGRPFAHADWLRAGYAADLRAHAGIDPEADANDFEAADGEAHLRGARPPEPAADDDGGAGESASPDVR